MKIITLRKIEEENEEREREKTWQEDIDASKNLKSHEKRYHRRQTVKMIIKCVHAKHDAMVMCKRTHARVWKKAWKSM